MTITKLQVDIFGPCNLRCPSCIIGSGGHDIRKRTKGLMSEARFAEVLDKALAEFPAIKLVTVHNWAEPLLHPRLPELIRLAKDRGLSVYASSNLNVLRREDDLLSSGIDTLAVSVSGATQETYGTYHAGGQIETVRENMRRLAQARQRTGSSTELVCIFHKYADNRADALEMREFATSLGYTFKPVWAYFTVVEKLLASQAPDRRYGAIEFTEADQALADRLAIPIAKRLAMAAQLPAAPCKILHDWLPIDVNGNVQLCCASGLEESTTIGSLLVMNASEIQSRREAHPLCGDCGDCNIPAYFSGVRGRRLNVAGQNAQRTHETRAT